MAAEHSDYAPGDDQKYWHSVAKPSGFGRRGGTVTTFADIGAAFLGRPGVEPSKMFGSDGLKVRGKVFAMQVKGALVVKLSKTRAEELVKGGKAQVFDPGHGRPMKQWIAVPEHAAVDWVELAEEAFGLVSGT
jgi:hypothetical protein